jgi:hypothetical protein
MTALAFEDIDILTGGQLGVHDVACPICGPTKRDASAKRRVLRIWHEDADFASYHCPRCPMKGYARRVGASSTFDAAKFQRQKAQAAARDREYAERQLGKARSMWRAAAPVCGTIVETYLRSRGIEVLPPATIRSLEPRKPEHHPAMVTAFGFPEEPEPGALSIRNEAVVGVHLTLLKPDGSGKADFEPNKITIGRCLGAPLVLAPLNDLLGLAISEGIEDALSVHQTANLGAWAAGSAGRLPALADAVPSYVDCVRVLVDDDEAGHRGARGLAYQLRTRGRYVELVNSSPKEIAA